MRRFKGFNFHIMVCFILIASHYFYFFYSINIISSFTVIFSVFLIAYCLIIIFDKKRIITLFLTIGICILLVFFGKEIISLNILILNNYQIILIILFLLYSIGFTRILSPLDSWVKLTHLSYRDASGIIKDEINKNHFIQQENLQIRERIYNNVKDEVEVKSFFLTGGISLLIQHAAHLFLPGLGFLFHGLSKEITEDVINTKVNKEYDKKKIPSFINMSMNDELRSLYPKMRALKKKLYLVTVSYFIVAFLIHHLSVVS